MDWQSFYDDATKTWRGKEVTFENDCNRSIGNLVFENLQTDPDRIIQISETDGKSFTKQEMLTAGTRIAIYFKNLKLNHKDFVGICARSSTYAVPVAVACYFNATPFHAVHHVLDENSLRNVYGNTKPKIIFCDGLNYNTIYNATKHFKPQIVTLTDHLAGVIAVTELLQPQEAENVYCPAPLTVGCDQIMAVICSSGTTGLPKAVTLSNRFLVTERCLEFMRRDNTIFSFTGLDWLTGIFFTNSSLINSCKRIITESAYSPNYFVEIMKKYKLTISFLAPHMAALLCDCPTAKPEVFSSLRVLLLGGSKVTTALLTKAQKLMQNTCIAILYGCSEISIISANFGLNNSNSVGRLVPGCMARIVNDDGIPVGPNETGEIIAYSGRAWNGYFGNDIETKAIQDQQGWIHTGDIGYFDSDNLLHVVDRKKEIYKCNSMHYWPSEIEAVIMELPQVLNVSVAGVYNETKGDAPGAVIIKRDGCALTEEQVRAHVAKRLPVDYKQLHAGVLFVDKLPVNPNGKVLRKQVQTMLINA